MIEAPPQAGLWPQRKEVLIDFIEGIIKVLIGLLLILLASGAS